MAFWRAGPLWELNGCDKGHFMQDEKLVMAIQVDHYLLTIILPHQKISKICDWSHNTWRVKGELFLGHLTTNLVCETDPSKWNKCSVFIQQFGKCPSVGPDSPREANCLVQKFGSQVNLIFQGEPGSVLQFVSSNRCIWNTIWQEDQRWLLWAYA